MTPKVPENKVNAPVTPVESLRQVDTQKELTRPSRTVTKRPPAKRSQPSSLTSFTKTTPTSVTAPWPATDPYRPS